MFFQPSLTVFMCTTQLWSSIKNQTLAIFFGLYLQRRNVFIGGQTALLGRSVWLGRMGTNVFISTVFWLTGAEDLMFFFFSKIEVHVSEKVNWNEKVENSLRRSLQKSLFPPKSLALSLWIHEFQESMAWQKTRSLLSIEMAFSGG